MIKKIILLLVVTLTWMTTEVQAQDNSSLEESSATDGGWPENGVYLELGGNAGIYSINYERFFKLDKFKVSGRLGLGLVSEGMILKPEDKKGLDLLIPFGTNVVYNIFGRHNVEFGLGATFHTYKVYAIETSSDNINQQPVQPELVRNNDFWPNFTIGYRFQKEDNGMYYRGFFNGHFTRRVMADNANSHSQYSVVTFDPWFGLSIGYGF